MIAKRKPAKIQKERYSGNYQVVGGDYGLSIAYVGSQELFDYFYRDKNLQERARVVVYMDKDAIDKDNGFAINLATGFVRFGGPYFKTRIVTKQEPETAKYAENSDIVINGFREPNEKFLDELEKYNDGIREFLDINDIWEGFKGYVNVQTLASYIHNLRNNLQIREGKTLEKIVA